MQGLNSTVLPLSSLPSRTFRPPGLSHLSARKLVFPTLLATLSIIAFLSWLLQSHPTRSHSRWTSATHPPYDALFNREVDWPTVGVPIPLDAGLETRLQDWENSPTVEPADWVRQSIQTCPRQKIVPAQNVVQVWDSHLLWSSLNSTVLYGLRSAMVEHLRKANAEGRISAWGSGRGLVFTAGNADTFSRVLLTLKLLHKHLDSRLPSEIFSFPGEEPDDDTRKQLLAFGATLRVVDDAVRDPSRTKNYHIKATAIIQSRFREVLYLDSDNMPTAGLAPMETPILYNNRTEEDWSDPAGLWESKAYKRLGVMQWPDYWRTSADNPIWAIIGVACRHEWEQEAGQILIDKKLHLDALLLAEWMMDSSRFKFWFNFSDGDKDMFRFAFLALRKRWAVPGRYVAGGMFPRPTQTGPCAHTMLQHDHRGRPMFVHANLLKQIPSGIGKGYAWGISREVKTFQNGMKYGLEEGNLDQDYDIDCDMLANAGYDGVAIRPAPPAVRRRAVAESGIRTFFHGGSTSALCVDMRWEDPRAPEDIAASKRTASELTGEPEDEVDVSFTASADGLEIKFEDPLQLYEWAEDVRLRDFENVFFEEGGHLNGVGF